MYHLGEVGDLVLYVCGLHEELVLEVLRVAEVRVRAHGAHDDFAGAAGVGRDVVLRGPQQVAVARSRLHLESSKAGRRVMEMKLEEHLRHRERERARAAQQWAHDA